MNRKKPPYVLHTSRELGMMLSGVKPLAVFTDGYESFPLAVRRYLRLFERHVREGRFSMREYVVPVTDNPRTRGWHTVMFALSGEEWRIDAMIELRSALWRGTWSHAEEREEGRLLGYQDWQIDWWMTNYTQPQN
jgi:hypothetical protein